jgi:hypothetical protein
VTNNADHRVTLRTVRRLSDYLFALNNSDTPPSARWRRVGVHHTDKTHSLFPIKDPAVVEGTTLRDYFNLKPGKESVASVQGPALILQCALGARQPERDCTRCIRQREWALGAYQSSRCRTRYGWEFGGKGRFTECRQIDVKEEKWLSRGACLNCWRLGKHAQCSLARDSRTPTRMIRSLVSARAFGPSRTRSGQPYRM